MATKFEDLVNGMVNVGFGAAATAVGAAASAAQRSGQVLDDLAAKGAETRRDAGSPDFVRSMSDAFEKAGGKFSEATERLSAQGESVAERILDELILARVRALPEGERPAFVAHVQALVDAAGPDAVKVEVESQQKEEPASDAAAPEAATGPEAAAGPEAAQKAE